MKQISLFSLFCLSAFIGLSQNKLSIYFDFDKDSTKDTTELFGQLANIRNYKIIDSIVIIGYTDSIGAISYNLDLAKRRALFASSILHADKEPRILIIGETNEFTYAKNRRADILVYASEIIEVDEIIEVERVPIAKDSLLLQIEFYNNSPVVKPEFKQELDSLLHYMERHPEYRVELHGHVCCGPGYELSLARAQTVQAYLIQNKIDADRISCFGLSNSRPLVPETSEENQQRNRRVECFFFDL